MKHLALALAMAFAASAASAAIVSTNNFETAYDGFSADGGDIASLVSLVDYEQSGQPSGPAPAPFSDFGSKYMSLNTDDAMVWRTFTEQSSDVYFDSYVKMTPCSGDIEYTSDAKFVVFLNADTNLCVISGTSAGNRAPVTNVLAAVSQVEFWHRLTVCASADGGYTFSVFLDGTRLGGTFYSLVAGATMSNVGLNGTGAIDDLVVRTTPPAFGGAAATIDGEDFATLGDALAAAEADTVVVLQSNNVENITLTEGQTFKLKANGFTYSGTVTSASGYRLETSGPDANGVITYSQAPSYKPSININFTDSGNGLTTPDDVGLFGYGVPGTSWNNFAAANATYSTVNAVDATGAASAMSGVSVTISGTRGSYSCSGLTAASNPLHGYIDEDASNPTPTVTVTGIPYYRYRVLVYHSTDTASVPFGYDTINGVNYTYVNDVLAEGTTATTAWGASGAEDSANEIAEDGNVLLTGELSGSTLTIVGHRAGGDSSARGCIAAIQIIEVKPVITDNDLEIPVSGNTTNTVSEGKTLSGTVYITGIGTLTLGGSAKITAATINVGASVILNVNADRLDGTTFTGAGTVMYDGSQPGTTKGFDNSAWAGTVWVKNIGDTSRGEATGSKVNTCLGSNTEDASSNDLNKWGNANSFVKFTNVRAYMAAANVPWTLILEDDSTNYAWYNNEGWTARTITIAGLKGSGTFWDINDGSCRPFLNFTDASQFSGSIKALGKQVFLNGAGTGNASDLLGGRIVVPADQVLSVAVDETWHTRNGLVVNGTLNVNGSLGSESTSSAVSGSGTVVFTGRAPTVSGDAWWKNANWTGTVEIKGATALNGDYAFNNYGNSGSTLKLTNCRGWLKPNYTCVPALEIGGTFSWTDGHSGLDNTFKVGTLKGSGTISILNQGAPTAVWQITDDWSGFTGAVVGNNSAAKRVLVFGSKLPASVTAGEIYVSEGATLDLNNSSAAWWGVGMGFVVDGTVRAINRAKWGGGTAMTLGDTGVLEITRSDSSLVHDGGTDYSKVTGTGTIKFAGDGFAVISQTIPTTLTFAAEKASGSVVPIAGATIGSLTGSKGFRSDWGNNGEGGRYLTIKQSKDTVWDGSINQAGEHRLTGVVVDPGESTAGTLTMTGIQTATSTLTVNGSVNLTGTWVGPVTVNGALSGTGAIKGDVTVSDGATLKLSNAADPLAVTGNLTVTGTVNIELPAAAGSVAVITATGTIDVSGAAFRVTRGGVPMSCRIGVSNGGLRIAPKVTVLTFF